jgi:hypothetical protein
MYENIKTFSIVIIFISFLTINTYVFYEFFTNLFKKLPKKSRFALIGLSFMTSPTLIYIGLIFDSHLLWVSLHIMAYSYLVYLKRKKLFDVKAFRIQDKYLFFGGMIILAQSIFVYYYDAINHISMNHPDNLANYNWAIWNSNSGEINYPPGLSSLVIPLMKMFDIFYNLNFIGATLGIVGFFVLVLTLRSIFEIKQVILLMIVLLSPLFNTLTTVRFGFHGGSTFQVILISYVAFLIVSIQNKLILDKLSLIFAFNTIIFTQAGLFSIPQIATLLILNLLLILILSYIKLIHPRAGVVFILSSFVGSLFAILYTSFTQIQSIIDFLYPSSSSSSSSSSITTTTNLDIIQDFLYPVLPIRPLFESSLSFISYLVLPILLYILYIALRNKNVPTLVVILTTLYFLFVTQTGIFEFSFAKGRAGWNTLLLVPISFILHFSNFTIRLKTKFLVVVAAMSFTTSLVSPPIAYRIESDEAHYEFKNLVSGREVSLYSDFSDAKFIGKNVRMISKEKLNYDLNSNYVLLNMSDMLPDLFKANIRRYEDRDYNVFYETQTKIINMNLKTKRIFIEQLKKQGYKVLLEESEFIILKG